MSARIVSASVGDRNGWRRFVYEPPLVNEGDRVSLHIGEGVLIVEHPDGTSDLCEGTPA